MTTFETEQKTLSQNSLLFLDCLYCEEKCWDYDEEEEEEHDHNANGCFGLSSIYDSSSSSYCFDDDEEEQLNALFLKEEKILLSEGGFMDASNSLMVDRREVLEWMIRVNSHHNFSAITLVLAVNYFDRFMLNFGFQKERPWVINVVAVACLSLASKVEETHVPLLLDFQVENKLIFEAKVIQKMELLVLSTLEWKMNAVTPLSYFGHLIRKFKLKTHFHWQILCRCECLIFSAILDPRYMFYAPSVLAAATMVQTVKEIGQWSTLEHQTNITDTLKLNKDKVEECYKFIQELASTEKASKRKRYNSASRSPTNVLDVVSNESYNNKDSSSSSSEPLMKKCRTVGPFNFG
ncbi:Cyclin-D3-1 [Bienertia sinuspersici]